MIVRNGQSTLPLALSSLMAQSYSNWECIVINDNSTDKTSQILDRLGDSRFIIRHYNSSLGRGQARSLALIRCSGQYIATLDADDFYFSHTLRHHLDTLQAHPEIVATVGPVLLFDQEERFLGRLRRHPSPGKLYIPLGPHEIKLPFGSMVFRRKLLEGYQYNATYNRSEDRDLYSRALAGKQVIALGSPTYAYRWNLSLEKVLLGLIENEQIYASHYRDAPLRTFILVTVNRLKYQTYRLLGLLNLWNCTNLIRIARGSEAEQELYRENLRRIKVLLSDIAF